MYSQHLSDDQLIVTIEHNNQSQQWNDDTVTQQHNNQLLNELNEISNQNTKQLKQCLRSLNIPLKHAIRHRLWLQLSTIYHKYSPQLDTEFDQQLMATNKLPNFVDPKMARFYHLSSSAKQHLTAILWSIHNMCPHITFAPLIYPLCSLFLHFHSPTDTYSAIMSLLSASRSSSLSSQSSSSVTFIGSSKADKNRDAIVLVKLTNKFGIVRKNFCLDARLKLRNNALDYAFAEFQQWIWIFLPFHYCVRIVDCFLVEGDKFLLRIALSLALLFEQKSQQKTITLEKMCSFCKTIEEHVSPQQLISEAIKITRLSRKVIAGARVKANERLNSVSLVSANDGSTDDGSGGDGSNGHNNTVVMKHDMISTKDYIIGARIAPRRFNSNILKDSWHLLDVLFNWLPDRVLVREPTVIYCSDENGHSLQTFYTLSNDNEPTIILIKTTNNEVFGAFVSTAWSRRFDSAHKEGQYFGTGETFVFELSPKIIKYDWIGKSIMASDGRDGEDVTPLSHSQQLFQSGTSRSISIGSGNGIAIFLDENLRGQSSRCDTFNNECLCDSGRHFNVAVLEVIAFS